MLPCRSIKNKVFVFQESGTGEPPTVAYFGSGALRHFKRPENLVNRISQRNLDMGDDLEEGGGDRNIPFVQLAGGRDVPVRGNHVLVKPLLGDPTS